MNDLIDKVEELKEKLTDSEYMGLYDAMKKLNSNGLKKITFIAPHLNIHDDDDDELSLRKHTAVIRNDDIPLNDFIDANYLRFVGDNPIDPITDRVFVLNIEDINEEKKPTSVRIIVRIVGDKQLCYHPESKLVFRSRAERIVIGKLDEESDTVIPLTESDYRLCHHWGFEH